jgi:hypothetical protein
MDTNENTNGNHRPEANQLIRKDFGGISTSRESAATAALTAKARADIEARWTMALHRPRNLDQVRTMLLKECRRPGFAASAIYRKPIGDGVEGLSIRFAEAAARCYGNVAMEVTQIYDDPDTRVMRVSATDLESNVTWPQDVTVSKTVERKFLRKGQLAVASRTNSYGDIVHLVEASDDDLLNKQGALVSKALRTCILRIIPGDLQDEAYDVCNAILKDAAAKNPDAARNAVCDAFAEQGIHPVNLEEWLGHKLDVATPVEIEQLRRLFVAIRDGEATWPEALSARAEQLAKKPESKFDAAKAKVEAKAAEGKGTGAVKDKLKGRNQKPEQQALPTTAPAPIADTSTKADTKPDDPEKEPAWMAGPPKDR